MQAFWVYVNVMCMSGADPGSYILQRTCWMCGARQDSLLDLDVMDHDQHMSMADVIKARRKCIDTHKWPGCEDDSQFTCQGEWAQVSRPAPRAWALVQ